MTQRTILSPSTVKLSKTELLKAKQKAETSEYISSRYDPQCKETVKQFIENELDSNMYPYIIQPPVPSNHTRTTKGAVQVSSSKFKAVASRIRSGVKNKLDTRSLTSPTSSSSPIATSKRKNKTPDTSQEVTRLVFMLGGASYSELRCMDEIRNESQSDVIFGT